MSQSSRFRQMGTGIARQCIGFLQNTFKSTVSNIAAKDDRIFNSAVAYHFAALSTVVIVDRNTHSTTEYLRGGLRCLRPAHIAGSSMFGGLRSTAPSICEVGCTPY